MNLTLLEECKKGHMSNSIKRVMSQGNFDKKYFKKEGISVMPYLRNQLTTRLNGKY